MAESQVESRRIDDLIQRRTPFDEIEDEIDRSELDDEMKAALWLRGFAHEVPENQRRIAQQAVRLARARQLALAE